jgi:hypothetical protein
MTKPENKELSSLIQNAKDISAVAFWWLAVPAYITVMLMMKSIYMPGTSLISNLKQLATSQQYIYIVFFIVSPLVLILVNILTIRNIYNLSGRPKSLNFLEGIWVNALLIVISALVLIIYSL